jgi:hypothetical protein
VAVETQPAEPASPYEPAPLAPPPAPAWQPPPPRRSRLWYASLLLAVVVTLGGLGMLYEDDTSWQRQANDLRSQNSTLHEQLLTTQSDLTGARSTITDLRTAALHPSLGIWNVQQRIDGPDYYLAGGVPDTFTYHLVASASGPMSVSIVTFEQFAAAVQCVHDGTGNTNYCMHRSLVANGIAKTFTNVRDVNYDFHLAEGCANYMVVFTAAGAVTVSPNVSVTYNPAPTFTGDC